MKNITFFTVICALSLSPIGNATPNSSLIPTEQNESNYQSNSMTDAIPAQDNPVYLADSDNSDLFKDVLKELQENEAKKKAAKKATEEKAQQTEEHKEIEQRKREAQKIEQKKIEVLGFIGCKKAGYVGENNNIKMDGIVLNMDIEGTKFSVKDTAVYDYPSSAVTITYLDRFKFDLRSIDLQSIVPHQYGVKLGCKRDSKKCVRATYRICKNGDCEDHNELLDKRYIPCSNPTFLDTFKELVRLIQQRGY